MGIVNQFFDFFGIKPANKLHPGARWATSTDAIAAMFRQEAEHQQSESYYFNRRGGSDHFSSLGSGWRSETMPDKSDIKTHNDFLKDGAAKPPGQ
jgi:hypothetical protein